jgi:hypothetical protein
MPPLRRPPVRRALTSGSRTAPVFRKHPLPGSCRVFVEVFLPKATGAAPLSTGNALRRRNSGPYRAERIKCDVAC